MTSQNEFGAMTPDQQKTLLRNSLLKVCCELGHANVDKFRYQEAATHFETALYLFRDTASERKDKARVYDELTVCHINQRQYGKAIHHVEAALGLAKRLGDKEREARANFHLCQCYAHLNQPEKAKYHFERFKSLEKVPTDKHHEGWIQYRLGTGYWCIGQHNSAIHHLEASFNIAEHTGNKELKSGLCDQLGMCYMEIKEYDKAVKYLQGCIEMARQFGNKQREAHACQSLGYCFSFLKQYDKAIYYLELGVSLQEQNPRLIGLSHGGSYFVLGKCYLFLKQYDRAELNFKLSIESQEKLFKSIPKQDQIKVSFREGYILGYQLQVRTLLLQEKSKEALVVAERSRSRALVELMYSNYALPCAEITEGKVLKLHEIREVVRTLNTTVVFYFLWLDRCTLWLIKPDGQIGSITYAVLQPGSSQKTIESFFDSEIAKVSKLPKGRTRRIEDCEDRSLSFLYPEDDAVQARTGNQLFEEEEEEEDETPSKAARKTLYKLLWNGVPERVDGSQVIIVPDGPLNLLPFAALLDENGHYLSESLQVRFVPSLATANLIIEQRMERGARDQTRPLIVGDPAAPFEGSRLPCANEEARIVGDLFGVQPLIGENATKEKVLQNLEHASLIHIAAHGDMKRGEILLAPTPGTQDYMLMLSDLEKKRVRAKLVVLSCCNSAQGEVKADGVIGIARAFLGAGAHSVLVALWAITDKATLYFMKVFYQHFSRGERASKSLSKAMELLRKDPNYSHPYYWAPFILIGDDVSLF